MVKRAAYHCAGCFRADLFHRLNVYPLRVPPLRERPQDIALLAGYFCDLARRRLGLGPVRLSAGSLEALRAYSWPGNVRELENVLSRVVLKAAASVPRGEVVVLQRAHFGTEVDVAPDVVSVDAEVQAAIPQPRPLREATLDFQRAMIRRALRVHNGSWPATARALGMHRSNLHHLASRLELRDEP